MSSQIWQPKDGVLLKSLREEAEIEITSLAHLHCLSKTQVNQLEEGGDSSFYSPEIKLASGRKLLMYFGQLDPLHAEIKNQKLTIESVSLVQWFWESQMTWFLNLFKIPSNAQQNPESRGKNGTTTQHTEQ